MVPLIYLIKFVYSIILPPGIFVLLLLGLALWIWNKNRRPAAVLLGITLLLYLCMTPLVSNSLIGSLEKQYTPPDHPYGDVIVVLGSGASTGTPDIDGKGNMYGPAANRLLTAVRLHLQTGLPILFSGGQVYADSGNEADIARRQLMGLGISEKDIITENRSLNTEQNAVNTAAILKEKGFSHPVLVTSGFHMPRAMRQFHNAGVIAEAYPADYMVSRPIVLNSAKFAPSAGALANTGLALKEYLGLLALKINL